MEKEYVVYSHMLFDGRRYIGKTSQPLSRRWRRNGEGYQGTQFYEAIKRYGWEAFSHEIIATELSEEQAKALEEKLIKQYKTQDKKYGFNTTGGESWTNPTEEQRERFSDFHRKNNIGKKHTEEYKRKMSERMKGENNPNAHGKLLTTERIESFREYAKKPKTETQKKRMSDSAKKRAIKCVETGEIYKSMKEASEALGIPYTSISCSIYRGNKTHGYRFITCSE